MLYDPSTDDALRTWLVKTLEPICDAEPSALATYVIALLAHDESEQDLRKEMVKQLEEFLDSGASNFVDQLFATLRSKSYIPYSTELPYAEASSSNLADGGIPIPFDGLISPSVPTSPGRGQKRNLDEDDREIRGPPKGPRLSGEQHFSRYPQSNGNGPWQRGMDSRRPEDHSNGDIHEGSNGFMGRGGRRFQGQQGERPMLPRGVCRDYHNKGYCARGAMCKFSHDDIAMSPGQLPFGGPMNTPLTLPGTALPFLPIYGAMPFNMNIPQQAYDPNEAHLDMRPTMQQLQSSMDGSSQQQSGGPGEPFTNAPGSQEQQQGSFAESAGETPSQTQDVQMGATEAAPYTSPHHAPRGGHGPYRGRGRGGRGTFHGDHQSFGSESPQRNDSKTLVVEKIPSEHLSLEAVNNWFKKFGTVTNVAVDVSGGKALVSFSSHEEARAAWGTEEAVFGNRFVKVFWHRPMGGQGAAGARALQASAPVVANLSARETAAATTAPTTTFPKSTTQTSKPPPALSALALKQQQLEKKIAEQKELMSRLPKATPEEKKEIMARLRKLEEVPSPAVAPSSTHTPPRAPSAGDAKEKKARELLDMELDIHSRGPGEEPSAEVKKSESGAETTESLQEKLAKLRAEASALGITDTTAPPHQPPFRGYRGRGRGRATYRGAIRGGPPRGSMKLDNRPKSILITVSSSQDPEIVQAVREFYEPLGQLSNVDVLDGHSVVAQFNTRAAAEQAFSKGSSIPSVGSVKIRWHVDSNPTTKTPISNVSIEDKKSSAIVEERPPSPRPDEVTEDSGWGNEEDGMGML